MIFKEISLRQIDTDDELFKLDDTANAPLTWDGLQPLYNPVWLQQKKLSSFRIIDGFKVIQKAGKSAPERLIPATVFPEDSNLVELWKQRVRKRAQEANLSTAAFLRGLSQLLGSVAGSKYPDGDSDPFFPSDIGRQTFNRDELSRLVRGMKQFERFTDIHQLGFKQIIRLSKKTQIEMDSLGQLLESMQLKGKKLSSLLDLIEELDRGYGVQLANLLDDKQITGILSEIKPHQRYRHIKSRLLTLRYPQLNQLNSDWAESLRLSGLEKTVEVRHDPYFEDDTLEFVFTAQDTSELKEKLKQVVDAADSAALNKLFGLI